MQLELELPFPPSINHFFSYYQGRPILSKDARAYRSEVRRLARAKGVKPLLGSLTVQVDAFPPDKRRRDLDNYIKSLLDALQYGGVFWDDSQVTVLHAIKHPPEQEGRIVVVLRQTEDKQVETHAEA